MSEQQWGNGLEAQEKNCPKPEIWDVLPIRQWLKTCVGDRKEMRDKEKQGQKSEARQRNWKEGSKKMGKEVRE